MEVERGGEGMGCWQSASCLGQWDEQKGLRLGNWTLLREKRRDERRVYEERER